MENKIDFKGLASRLLGQHQFLLSTWLPGGKLKGKEYVCSSLQGGQGDSLKINTESGKWSDFATSEKGGDLISLYAAIYGVKQGEAAKTLATDVGFNLGTNTPTPIAAPEIQVTAPPKNAGKPVMTHAVYGEATGSWCYKSETDEPLFYISRYDPPQERKQFLPWSWAPSKARFIQRSFPAPRPMYGLELLSEFPDLPVMIVEGEKAAEAARKFAGHVYNVMSWPNGVQSIEKVDWFPIHGKKVILWPDADEPGKKAVLAIAKKLLGKCTEVKILDTTGEVKGWDAADSGFNWTAFAAWAKPRAAVYTGQEIAIEPDPVQVITPTEIKQAPVVTVTFDEDMGEVPESLASAYEKMGIATTRAGTPICNIDNALRVLEGWPAFKDVIWFDEFHCKFFTTGNREWNDLDELKLLAFMQRELGMRNVTEGMVRSAATIFAHRHARNEPKDWIDSLVWDGKERIEPMFAHYLGADTTEYTAAASKNWWISMVARIYQPGAKVDSMVILEGAQGRFKSTALGVIGGRWYAESHEAVTSKDFYMALQGKLIVEISELDAFSKAEVNTIKKVITCQSDRFRPPYGRVSMDFPRRCVFVGTTNETAYLRDATGARRFWPVAIGKILIDQIKADRDQLFAEAAHRYKAGEIWYKMPKEAADVQEARRQHDEWESKIAEYLIGFDEVKMLSIAQDCLGIIVAKFDNMTQRRIGKVLHQLGWYATAVRRDGVVIRVWTKKEINDLPEV